jgi:selenium-binding protein 1
MPETTDPTFPCGPGAADARFLPHGDDFHCLRLHQTRLQGGDASSDSYYYTG